MDNSVIKIKKFKSHSLLSLLDIFAPRSFKDILQFNPRNNNNISVFRASCNNCYKGKCDVHESVHINHTPYITSENYHALNRNGSNKSVVRSTSSLFYDLDKIVQRHSYHCVTDTKDVSSNSKTEILKCSSDKPKKLGFETKTETIVQECATQIQPKLQIKDSLKINGKKIKRKLPNRLNNSEIHQNDDSKTNENNFYVNHEDEDYAYPIIKEKKCKKKDRGNIKDPCPCQLFSYACPCTDKKSLTELAKSSKALTVAEQITSTAYFENNESTVNNDHTIQNVKKTVDYEKNIIRAHLSDLNENYEIIVENSKPSIQTNNTQHKPSVISNKCTKNSINTKSKHEKRPKTIICPRCKEKLDILSTEDECCIMSKIRKDCTESNQENENYDVNSEENTDICNHNPPCELVPVCQIIPKGNGFINTQYVENVTAIKHNQKTIRLTKACRHHPPCTVVPSCQRINVLKNNCEYIPPCLHRPRCVNLPLCAPLSKKTNYDEILQKQNLDKKRVEHTNSSLYKSIPEQQHGSLNNCIKQQFYTTQNTCEYLSEYSPRLVLRPTLPCVSPTLSPFYSPTQIPCKCRRYNKSCQYDCSDCKCDTMDKLEEEDCVETVVYIRDVGCQFKNNNLYSRNSLIFPKDSSTSLDLNTNTNRFYTNFHTLRYEDKYTNPISGEKLSMSTFTSSLEIDEQCPSHGKQANKKYTTGIFNAASRT